MGSCSKIKWPALYSFMGEQGENQMITDMKAYKKEYNRAYNQKHKDDIKAYKEANREKLNAYWREYRKADVNSFGKSKDNIRTQSLRYLKKHGTKIPGYQIHHCFTYDEPYKFIYCSKEKHLEIHQFLRDNDIDANTNHYEQIKHLLDDTVVVYGL